MAAGEFIESGMGGFDMHGSRLGRFMRFYELRLNEQSGDPTHGSGLQSRPELQISEVPGEGQEIPAEVWVAEQGFSETD